MILNEQQRANLKSGVAGRRQARLIAYGVLDREIDRLTEESMQPMTRDEHNLRVQTLTELVYIRDLVSPVGP